MESDEGKKHFPVRAYIQNTFGSLLNDALYELQRTRGKCPECQELLTVKGSAKYIGEYLIKNLPANEK